MLPPILQIGDILISSEILTEQFCCDLSVCKGQCCIEGDAGAPVTLDEIGEIEQVIDEAWNDLSASAQSVIDKQGVAYTDEEGDLVTSIVNGKDCVFTYYDDINIGSVTVCQCCLCALEKAYRAGKTRWCKPISCSLYPIREKVFRDGTIALNLHHWKVCECAFKKGRELQLPVYQFLKEPLIRRFGTEWYEELCEVSDSLREQGYL